MKKLLVAALACALFVPAFAAFDNVKVTGDIQTIGYASENVATNAQRFTSNRVLFGLGMDLVEDVRTQVTFGYASEWGDSTTTGDTVQGYLNTILVKEAYVAISNVFDALEVKVGRQFYGDENSAVMYFGPIHGYANLNALNRLFSLDGVTATYTGDKLTATAVYFNASNNSGTHNDDHMTITGLDAAYKATDELTAQAYIYDIRFGRGNGNHRGFWGVKPTYENDMLKASVEFARNMGHIEPGFMLKADVAMPLALDNMDLTPRATFYRTAKTFYALGNYIPGLVIGNSLGGALNNMYTGIAFRDITLFNAGLDLKLAALEKFALALDFYADRVNSSFVANEWDAKVTYNHNEYVAFTLAGGILTNVHASWHTLPSVAQLAMNIKF